MRCQPKISARVRVAPPTGRRGGRVATFVACWCATFAISLDLADDAPGPARRLGVQLAAIVRSASAHRVGSGVTTALRCTKRLGRRPCDGYVMVFRRINAEIAWSCDVCGDDGVITGWEGSPTDVSGLDDGYADGDEITAVVSREAFDALRGVLLLDAACELVVARAQGTSSGVLLAGRVESFEELVGYVAAESNVESDRNRVRRLDAACTMLEATLGHR